MDFRQLQNKLDKIVEDSVPNFKSGASAEELAREITDGLDNTEYSLVQLQNRMRSDGKQFKDFPKMFSLISQLQDYALQLAQINRDKKAAMSRQQMYDIIEKILSANPPAQIKLLDGTITLDQDDINKLTSWFRRQPGTIGDFGNKITTVSGVEQVLRSEDNA